MCSDSSYINLKYNVNFSIEIRDNIGISKAYNANNACTVYDFDLNTKAMPVYSKWVLCISVRYIYGYMQSGLWIWKREEE